VKKPTYPAFGTRGAADAVRAIAIEPRSSPALEIPGWFREFRVALAIKCAIALWVVAILYVVFWARADALF
jgi:hypothetical protein